MTRPPWSSLPLIGRGAERSAWELLADERGALSELTEQHVRDAAALVRTGTRIPLNLPLDQPKPPLFGREPYRQSLVRKGPALFDDFLDNVYLQGSSQWDSLSHFGHVRNGFWGGTTPEQVEEGALGIDRVAGDGIATRGILLDLPRWAAETGTEIPPPDERYLMRPEVARAILEHQGVTPRHGDVWLVRSGWLAWYLELDDDAKLAVAHNTPQGGYGGIATVGIGPGTGWAEMLWDAGAVAIAIDNPATDPLPVEKVPETDRIDSMHLAVLAMLGILLGELWDLERLSQVCAERATHEFMLVSVPLVVPRGTGSPPNAIALL